MKRLVVKHRWTFTLVEIMVTMAILVVMMSFLFQFVIGAQRIWSATTKDTEMFEQAQIIFNVMETDLKNMICEVPDDNPDGGMQVYLERNASNRLERMCFMTSYPSEGNEADNVNRNLTTRVGVYPVCYHLVPSAGGGAPYRLYRYNFDRIPAGTSNLPFFAYASRSSISGANGFNNRLETFRTGALTSSERDQLRELISEEIEELIVEVFPSSITSNLLTEKPISLRLTVTLRQRELTPNPSRPPETRRFTKIVFVD